MSSRVVYAVGFLMIAAGITLDVVTGGDGGWRLTRSLLIGGGVGAVFARFVAERQRRRQRSPGATS